MLFVTKQMNMTCGDMQLKHICIFLTCSAEVPPAQVSHTPSIKHTSFSTF